MILLILAIAAAVILILIFGTKEHDSRLTGGDWFHRRHCDKCQHHWSAHDSRLICPHCANMDTLTIRLIPARYEWPEHLLGFLWFKPSWCRGHWEKTKLKVYKDGRIPKNPAE